MSEPIVALREFRILREGVPLFQPLRLEVRYGDAVSIVGRNGAGKSVLLKALAGIDIPSMSYCGVWSVMSFIGSGHAVDRSRAGATLIRQIPTAYRGLVTIEQMYIAAHSAHTLISSILAKVRGSGETVVVGLAKRALIEFGLDGCADAPISNLSLGQRRAVSLAALRVRLELGQLKLLLLDEPQSGLDTARLAALQGLVKEAVSAGCAAIIAEHSRNGIEPLGDRVVELHANGGAAP